MALTLLEAAKAMTGDVYRQQVVEIFATSHPLLEALPFETIPGNAISFNREGTLPTTAFRAVNAAYTASTGILEPVVEKLFISGGDLDVDSHIIRTMGEQRRSSQEAMKIKALAHNWAHKVIKGNNQTTPAEFDGLQARCIGTQLVNCHHTDTTDGGDELTLVQLDAMIDQVVGPTHLLMSRAMKRKFIVAARTSTVGGNILHQLDNFGVPITSYNGLPIITMDDPNMANATLAFDEAGPGGTTATATSIYCVALREEMLTGIQGGDPIVTDLGELQTQPQKRTRVEWDAGISQWNIYSAARCYGIKNEAIAA